MIAVADVQRAVAAEFATTRDRIISADRHRPLVIHRHIAMALAMDLTGQSCCAVARLFRRDHATIIHGVANAARWIARDDGLASATRRIRARLIEEARHVGG